MTTTKLNIAHLIERNAMTRLSKDYENRFLRKIKEKFSESQQQLFASTYYCFLNYNKKKDFVIDFDNVWKWLGFTRKDPARKILEKHFTIDIDYKIILPGPPIGDIEPTPEVMGTPNLDSVVLKESIMLTVNTFRKFCLKAGTKKADDVHDFHLNLEDLLLEAVSEESNELQLQLGYEQEIADKGSTVIEEAPLHRDKLGKGQVIYVGTNNLDVTAFKVGITGNALHRVCTLSTSTTADFEMKRIWHTRFNKEIEESVKKNFPDHRILKRKEFYKIEEYETIISYIDNLVKAFNDTDINPPLVIEPPRKRKVIKNPLKLAEKPCTVCNETKPLEEFHFAKEHTDGRQNRCKVCATKAQEEHIKNKRETEPVPQEKECTQCHEVFPLTNFYVDAQKFDGRGTKCKDCFKEIQKKDKPKIDVTEYCCTACKVTKPLDEFHKFSRSKTGHHFKCKECVLAEAKEIYHRKKEGDAVVTN
jgi:hypothetical protein